MDGHAVVHTAIQKHPYLEQILCSAIRGSRDQLPKRILPAAKQSSHESI